MYVMRIFTIISIVLIVSIGASTGVSAQEQNPKFYFSLNYGNVDYSDASSEIATLENELGAIGLASDFTYDDSDTGFRLTGGIQANKNLAFTLSYVDLGAFTFNGSFTDGIDIVNVDNGKIETSGLELAVLFSLNLE